MVVYVGAVFLIYFVLVIALIVGWQIATEEEKLIPTRQKFHRISVIIPFRNEALNLNRLLQSIGRQEYLSEYFEVLLVDDHSTDHWKELDLSQWENVVTLRLIQLPENRNGKKSALEMGINQAVGEIIVTTDCDCEVTPYWLSTINQKFQNENIKMLTGIVKIQGNTSLFSKLQEVEFASLIGTSVAALTYQWPIMANGANLAFRKSIFFEVGGYSDNLHIPSGDDEFVMQKIHHNFPKGVSFFANPSALVTTQPQKNIGLFLQQRIRWAGKWRVSLSIPIKILAVFIFLLQITFILLTVWMIKSAHVPSVFYWLIGVKGTLEFLFLYQVCTHINIPWRWYVFFILQLIYPIYVIWVAIWANGQSYVWKDRTIKQG